MQTVGLDIGGATLKAADPTGRALSDPYPLWKSPHELAGRLARILASFAPDRLAVTMTGELCDCFETKADGVRRILDAVATAFAHHDEIRVWQTTGRFATIAQACAEPWRTAAANWLALATYAARFTDDANALLVDIGSTTTDIVPLRAGKSVPVGLTDPDRLASGELIYQAVVRTPICALIPTVRIAGRDHATMAELFATTRDAYLTLGDLPEDPSDTSTADGRPATRAAALARLARMIGSDRDRFEPGAALEMAQQVREAQSQRLRAAIRQVTDRSLDGRIDLLLTSGQGEFLIDHLVDHCPELHSARRLSLSHQLGPAISHAACAHAVAILYDES